jgi:hypothetical protein
MTEPFGDKVSSCRQMVEHLPHNPERRKEKVIEVKRDADGDTTTD